MSVQKPKFWNLAIADVSDSDSNGETVVKMNPKHGIADPNFHDASGLSDGFLKSVGGQITTSPSTASVEVREVELTLLASGWVNESAGLEQTVSCENAGARQIGLSPLATDAQYDACASANIRLKTFTNSTLTFRAMTATAPDVDIPIIYWELV